MGLKRFWKKLPVARKLYLILGVMALIITTELFVLLFAMNTLSAVRAFASGESAWSKAHKEALICLHQYALTRDPIFYEEFFKQLKVPEGDRRARLALEKNPADIATAAQGFRDGLVHEEDIPDVINLFKRFQNFKHLKDAIVIWRQGDDMSDQLVIASQELHERIQTNSNNTGIQEILDRIAVINTELTLLENQFAEKLGEGSRWVEMTLLYSLLAAVMLIQGCGLILTLTFSRNLSQTIQEINSAAHKVGQGFFDVRVPVHSKDDLGQLAESLNKMAFDLKSSVGGRIEAENASHAKSLFLANMSHEIRTPLSAIIGFSDLLKSPNLSEVERLQYAEIIHRTGEQLTTIINDVLDLSKVEAGHLQVEKRTVHLPSFLEELNILMMARCKDKPVTLSFEKQGDVPSLIQIDGLRLRQILTNIIGNAIKFTDRGSVNIAYKTAADKLVFKISDTGVGIDPKQTTNLFKAFNQADSSMSRRHEGTGLGLVLSRNLAHLLGGDVVLEETQLAHGSTFSVSVALDLPSKESPAPLTLAASSVMSQQLSSKSILLVDDVEDNRLLIEKILKKKGATLSLATNGQEGLEKALKSNFDVILMDIQMPVMDGYSATKALRSAGYTKPIIALTAHAMKDDRERCLTAGCTDYLTKPVNVDILVKTILSHSS